MKWIFAALSLIVQPFMPYAGEFPPEVKTAAVSAYAEEDLALKSLLEIFGIDPDASPAEIVAETQRLWLQKGKERWEFDSRYESLKPKAWPLFEKMGYLTKAEPRRAHYDYALVHGALLSRVGDRVAYLASLCNQGMIRFDSIVFLTGARPLQESEKQVLPNLSTEREMVEWVYNHSGLPKDLPVVFIDAPMKQRPDGSWLRPQTSDTILHWLISNPSPGSCLAISNQPYVAYQDAVARNHLPSDFDLETVGPAPIGSLSVSLLLDTLAKELYEKYE